LPFETIQASFHSIRLGALRFITAGVNDIAPPVAVPT
jgi:hypothetical protein